MRTLDEDVMEILETALKLEQTAQKRYKKGMEASSDPEIKALFEELYRDEVKHEKAIRERIKAIKLIRGMG